MSPAAILQNRQSGSDIGLDEAADRVERAHYLGVRGVPADRRDVERQARALLVGIDLDPAVIRAALGAPFDAALRVVGLEPRLTLLRVPVIAGLDCDLVAVVQVGAGHLRHVVREVGHVRERGVHLVGIRGDVMGVLVLHRREATATSPARAAKPSNNRSAAAAAAAAWRRVAESSASTVVPARSRSPWSSAVQSSTIADVTSGWNWTARCRPSQKACTPNALLASSYASGGSVK